MFNYAIEGSIWITPDCLNTYHVNVQLISFLIKSYILISLNTYHVNVQRKIAPMLKETNVSLNTYHVNVQLKFINL